MTHTCTLAARAAAKTIRARLCGFIAMVATAALLGIALPATAKTSDPPLKLTGMLRYNYAYKDWNKHYRHGGQLDFDTAALGLELSAGPWIGSAQYRYYHYEDGHMTHFLHHGWIGYRFDQNRKVEAGVSKVPFGILPYASHNWFLQLPYYLGLEDSYALGVKYVSQSGPWGLRLAAYPRDGGNYRGESEDSARYTYDVVEGLGVHNEQRNQLNARLAYTLQHAQSSSTEIGFSAQWAQVHNQDTDKNGHQYALGVHLRGSYGRWGTKLEAIRYRYYLRNPAGQSEDVVIRGAYDFPYRAAARGTLYVAGLSYTLPVAWHYVDHITFYDDYSRLVKGPSDFARSEENVLGASIAAGHFLIYADFAYGRNHPFLSPAFTDGLAAGSGDKQWHHRYNLNVGYYF